MQLDCDVIVVGAGPVGSRVAGRLAAMGHDVILLEKRQTFNQPVCCTGIISLQCLEQFNIAHKLVLREYRGAIINSPGGTALSIVRPGVQAVAVDRAALDQCMAERAASSGARIFLDSSVTEVSTSKNETTVKYIQGGSLHTLHSRSVVIAAGLSPRLTQMLGLGKIRNAALGFQLEVETLSPVGIELFIDRKLTPGFFAWMAPVSDSRAKIGLIARRRGDGNLQALIDRLRSQGKIGTEIDEVRCRAIPLSTLPRTYADRILVVGDSAGQVKPTTGGGLYYGLLCADIAADTLNSALTVNDLSATSLKTYEKDWRSKIGRDLFIGRIGRFVFQHLSDRRLDHMMLKARDSGAIDRLLSDDSLSFDWHGKAVFKAAGSIISSIL